MQFALPILSFFALLAPLSAQATFVDQTQSVGLSMTHQPVPGHPMVMMLGGGTVGDFNNDGWPDVFVPSGGTTEDKLFINDGNGTFTDRAVAWGLTDLHMGVGSAVGDFDNDGWQDLYVTSFGVVGNGGTGQNRLYRNNGDSTFTDVAVAAGVNAPSGENDCFGAAFGDYDKDGDLDLFVAAYSLGTAGNTLYRNNGDSTFTAVNNLVGIGDLMTTRGFVPSFTDFDMDGQVDILLIGDSGTSKYLRNNGDNTFALANNLIPELNLPNGMGLTTADFNQDLQLDLYVSDIYQPTNGIGGNRMYLDQGTDWALGGFTTKDCGWGWGPAATDIDNDGLVDIVATNGWFGAWENYPSRVFYNQGSGVFAEVAAACGLNHFGQGRSTLRLDADRDGDDDIIITESSGPLTYFENQTVNQNHWLRLSFDTQHQPALAPNGFGTQVYVKHQGETRYQQLDSSQSFLGQHELTLHFGLGMNAMVEEIKVVWADGSESMFVDVAADQHLVIQASAPHLSVSGAAGNQTATLDLTGGMPNSFLHLAVSLIGPGPTATPFGEISVSRPFTLYRLYTDSTGNVRSKQYLPGWMSGMSVWAQAADPISHVKSNPLAITVQ
jgi:enediyne biosynthesis protein E4